MPVTTVPKPRMVKTRSMGRRKIPLTGLGGTRSESSARVARSSGAPAPVTAEKRTRGAPSRKVPLRASRTSSATSSSQSSSTRSTLVRTTSPSFTLSNWQISRCSLVWGMTPSSAAMTRATRSMPVAPATMWRTKRSWPGTSTIPRWRPLGRARSANPSSMVMPRNFSSLRRSGSTPVRALMRELLPWSMWPAVPRMMGAVDMVNSRKGAWLLFQKRFRLSPVLCPTIS